jgi:hypothetical protein
MEDQIVFGDQMIPITLPDGVRKAPPGLSTALSTVAHIRQGIHRTLPQGILCCMESTHDSL